MIYAGAVFLAMYFLCQYCGTERSTFVGCVEHCILNHADQSLSYTRRHRCTPMPVHVLAKSEYASTLWAFVSLDACVIIHMVAQVALGPEGSVAKLASPSPLPMDSINMELQLIQAWKQQTTMFAQNVACDLFPDGRLNFYQITAK